MVVSGWEEWKMKVLFNGYGVSVWENEKVLKMDTGLHNIVNILDAAIPWHLFS